MTRGPAPSSPHHFCASVHSTGAAWTSAWFPSLGLEQSEVATISNASFNVVKASLELYNKLEA